MIALVEFAGAPFRVVIALLAGVDRVRGGRRDEHKLGVIAAIGSQHGFAVGVGAGADQPAFVGAAVEKQNGAIGFRMDIRFHCRLPLK